jgi:hypothetical protein
VPGRGNPGFRRGQTQGECATGKIRPSGPRDHVQMVFSHRIRAANKTAKGEAPTHQTLRKLGKAPGICTALHSTA